jgi:hypothetical protein
MGCGVALCWYRAPFLSCRWQWLNQASAAVGVCGDAAGPQANGPVLCVQELHEHSRCGLARGGPSSEWQSSWHRIRTESLSGGVPRPRDKVRRASFVCTTVTEIASYRRALKNVIRVCAVVVCRIRTSGRVERSGAVGTAAEGDGDAALPGYAVPQAVLQAVTVVTITLLLMTLLLCDVWISLDAQRSTVPCYCTVHVDARATRRSRRCDCRRIRVSHCH